MNIYFKRLAAVTVLIFFCFISENLFSQHNTLEFGTITKLDALTSSKPAKNVPLKWINVNTAEDTWTVKDEMLICTGLPIGVMRSEKQYENFILHVEWRHMEKGGNSGVFVWSNAVPGEENRLPDGVEVQMLELGWVELNTKDGVVPPIAYVHGELFGVGGVKTVPDNPRGERSKSIQNLCKGKGEWNTYDVVCVDGVIKLAVNGIFVNGIRNATQKKGYLCLEAEGALIHMRNFKLIELPPGVPLNSSSQEQPFTSYSQKIENSKLQIQMNAIPAGEFMMGSPEKESGRKNDEGPLHKVNISAFWISAHEIPWDIYDLFVYRDSDSAMAGKTNLDAVTRPTKPYLDMTFGMGKKGFPAVAMTQYNAIQFCKWLYLHTGIFYRLPTEAEWEYACRSGSTGAYHFGNKSTDLAGYAWFKNNSNGKTMPIGLKKPNAWGLYDMYGNVAEWTFDQYIPDSYKQHKNTTSTNPVAEPKKLYPLTLRGGSFMDNPEECRSASRKRSDPSWKRLDPQIPKSNWWFPEAPFVGVRLVRPINTPPAEEINAYYNKKPIIDY